MNNSLSKEKFLKSLLDKLPSKAFVKSLIVLKYLCPIYTLKSKATNLSTQFQYQFNLNVPS